MSSCCSTAVVCLSASAHVVNISSSILWHTWEGMPLRYLLRSSRVPYPERSTRPLNSAENSVVVHLSRVNLSAQSLASLKLHIEVLLICKQHW
ncbi:hypothetical protein IEO21_10683 [Rhodonia placenta]|uniref:Uncharacterized protein n=1 Tax=Rhodonia placenta TaxID=104341 RepID=A0A8H7NS06_9APHY|nr:hypothetical protein IEO21_10683 [Postia placenta]